MASFFIPGEMKIRPGVNFRYENWGQPPIAGVDDGRCAAVIRSNWGPIGRPIAMENFEDIARIYGGGGENGTTAVAKEQFRGGARLVFGMRLGVAGVADPGTPGEFQIMDAGATPASVIQLTMKENNSTPYQIYLGPSTGDPDIGELDLLLGSDKLETISFDISTGADQIAGLLAAAALAELFTLTLISDTGNALAMPTVAPLVPGTDPVANGSVGTYEIEDSNDDAVIRMVMLHPGSRPFNVAIRPTIQDESLLEFLLLDGTTILERFTFSGADGVNQIDALIAARETQGSNFFTLTKLGDGTETLAVVTQTAITPGTDPEINVAAYSAAFEALEAWRWNVLSIDTDDVGVQMMMQMFLNRIYRGGGKWTIGVIGQDRSIPFETRLVNASAYNDYQIVYVGTGFIDMSGAVHEGWLAAARIAGLIAGTPSTESIARLAITGATALTENLTNFDYERSIQAGMLTFSLSSANTVWVESGINTLVIPGTTEDEGWKKIKRVKVRFELFQRLNDTVERLVARINNDPDGRMTIIQSGNAVCNAMMAERKLLAGAHLENDAANPPKGDSAWFRVFADDIDALEKMYFTFMFRFAPDEAV